MAEEQRLICPSGALADSGRGVRFEVEYFGQPAPAFAVRHAGRVHGYLNRCAHVAMELDWQEGVFFDFYGRDLIWRCLGGPCNRTPLVKLRLEERDGSVYFMGFQDD